MKKIINLSIFAVLTITIACNNSKKESSSTTTTESAKTETSSTAQTFTLDTTQLASGTTFYQCEMHADVNSDKPGNCPKCGMDLTEMKKQ